MAKLFKELIRRTFLAKYDNLVALDDPYLAIKHVLRNHRVTGILDAGASNGRVGLKLLRYFPNAKAYAFEANAALEQELKKAAEENPRLVAVRPCALSDTAGTLELNIAQSQGVTSIFQPNKGFQESYPDETIIQRKETVEAITIDDWVKQNGKVALELMKFDIQSAELMALKGATKTLAESTLAIYTEVFFNPMYEGGAIYSEIDLFLRGQGFGLYNIYKPRAHPDGMLDQANAVFVNTSKINL